MVAGMQYRAGNVQHQRWSEQNIPTIPSQKPAEIDRKPTQHQRHKRKNPSDNGGKPARYYSLNIRER